MEDNRPRGRSRERVSDRDWREPPPLDEEDFAPLFRRRQTLTVGDGWRFAWGQILAMLCLGAGAFLIGAAGTAGLVAR
jgi:hypothetical protein